MKRQDRHFAVESKGHTYHLHVDIERIMTWVDTDKDTRRYTVLFSELLEEIDEDLARIIVEIHPKDAIREYYFGSALEYEVARESGAQAFRNCRRGMALGDIDGWQCIIYTTHNNIHGHYDELSVEMGLYSEESIWRKWL